MGTYAVECLVLGWVRIRAAAGSHPLFKRNADKFSFQISSKWRSGACSGLQKSFTKIKIGTYSVFTYISVLFRNMAGGTAHDF